MFVGYCSKKLAALLDEKGKRSVVHLQTVTGKSKVDSEVISMNLLTPGNRKISLNAQVLKEFPRISKRIEKRDLSGYDHLKDLEFEEDPSEIDLIIGQNCSEASCSRMRKDNALSNTNAQ